MHYIADKVENSLKIPLLRITDSVGYEINKTGYNKVGLIGSKYTMESDFFQNRLFHKHGINAIVPDDEEDRDIIEDIIFNELVFNKIKESSKQKIIKIIFDLEKRGAQGTILGCTELGLLVNEKDISIRLFDSTRIHALHAAEYSLR